MVVEKRLQLLVRVVNAQLLERVVLEDLEPENVQYTCDRERMHADTEET